MNRWGRFFSATQKPEEHINEWCNRVRTYATSCGIKRFTNVNDQKWLIHYVMSNGLRKGKASDKYFNKMRDIETDMTEEMILQAHDDVVRAD